MSDNLNLVSTLKFKDRVSIGSISPKLQKTFQQQSKVVLTLYLTHRFVNEIYDAQNRSQLRYSDILNSQISCFQLKVTERIEKNLTKIAQRVKHELKNKFRSGGKRYTFLAKSVSVAVYEHELENVRELSYSLDHFNHENLKLEERCSDLLKQLGSLQEAKCGLSLENSNLLIEENSLNRKIKVLQTKVEEITKTCNDQLSNIETISDSLKLKQKQYVDLESDNTSIDSANKRLTDYVAELESLYLTKRKKTYDAINDKNKVRHLRKLATQADQALWFAEAFGLTPKVLKCTSSEGKNVNVKLGANADYSALESCDKQKIRELIYILDKFSISDAAYYELTAVNEDIPRKYLIVQERSNINELFHVERTPGLTPGAFVSIKDEITSYIKRKSIENSQVLKVKLSGDGARVSRISNFVTISISFPDEETSLSTKHIKAIAVIKCNESYEDISVCCNPIFSAFNELINNPEIIIDEKVFKLDLFFNGDMKFIQICMGLSGATSNFACPWCLIHKDVRTDTSKPSDFYESDDMKRTVQNINSHFELKTHCCKNKPLINIEPAKIVPDELHLYLRISDVLLSNLIEDCKQQDTKLEILKQKADQLKTLVEKINECGVNFHTWSDRSGEMNYSSLTGSQYKKLYKSLPDKLLFTINSDTHDDTVFLWREFDSIHTIITKQTVYNIEQLFERIKKWTKTFLSLESKGRLGYNRVTPYMHCFLYHIPQFVSKYGKLLPFSGQGTEKMNDEIKLIHQKRSNKQDQTYDDLITRKRMEFLMDSGYEREKHKYTKTNESYWEEEIYTKNVSKKRKIEYEIAEAQIKYKKQQKENEPPLEKMTLNELKSKLKVLGVSTKARKKEKLIMLIRDAEAKLATN